MMGSDMWRGPRPPALVHEEAEPMDLDEPQDSENEELWGDGGMLNGLVGYLSGVLDACVRNPTMQERVTEDLTMLKERIVLLTRQRKQLMDQVDDLRKAAEPREKKVEVVT